MFILIELGILLSSLLLISFNDLTRRILSYILFIIFSGLWMMKEIDKFFGYILIWITISGLGVVYIQIVIGWGKRYEWPYKYNYIYVWLIMTLVYILKKDYKIESVVFYRSSLENMIRSLFEVYWWYSIWIGLLLLIGMVAILRILRGSY